MGYEEYLTLAARYRVPIVVTGFEPVDLLEGILMAVRQLEAGRHEVENQYARAVRRDGQRRGAAGARRGVRGLRPTLARARRRCPRSGLRLRDGYRDFDAETRFEVGHGDGDGAGRLSQRRGAAGAAAAGRVRGLRHARCTPERPLGAPMVSSEGACAAYWKYGRPAVRRPVRRGMSEDVVTALTCPLPLDRPATGSLLAHGEGARLTRRLDPRAYSSRRSTTPLLRAARDGAVLPAIDGRGGHDHGQLRGEPAGLPRR